MSNKFNTGDVVKLKSGGPDMTVKTFSAVNGNYRCQWFAGKKLEEGIFQPDTLELVTK